MIIGLQGNKTHNDAGVKDDRMINNTIKIYEVFFKQPYIYNKIPSNRKEFMKSNSVHKDCNTFSRIELSNSRE